MANLYASNVQLSTEIKGKNAVLQYLTPQFVVVHDIHP